jgi:hypothetical protein
MEDVGIFLWQFCVFYGQMVYFMVIWYILWSSGIYFFVLVCCTQRKIWQPWSASKHNVADISPEKTCRKDSRRRNRFLWPIQELPTVKMSKKNYRPSKCRNTNCRNENVYIHHHLIWYLCLSSSNMDSILRHLNLQLQRQLCNRIECFYIMEIYFFKKCYAFL